MNTALKQTQKKEAKIILLNPEVKQMRKLINATWLLAKSAFWNNEGFTKREKESFAKLIYEHFEKCESADGRFKDLAERICIAKRYVSRQRGRYVAKPIDWLNINFRFGFAGTESWLKSIKEQRKTVPHYNKGTATLAEGIFEFLKTPDATTVKKYRKRLADQKQFDLLQIFINTITNLQYEI